MKTPAEILGAALAREKEARDFYGDLARQCRVDFVRQLLERLKDEESKHVRLIQDMMTKLSRGKDIV
jgi:rubrerythrin